MKIVLKAFITFFQTETSDRCCFCVQICKDLWVKGYLEKGLAQWSEGVTKPPWSSEQIEVNLSLLKAFGYIFSQKVFLNI